LDGTQILLDGAREGDSRQLGALLERVRNRIVLWVASHMSPALLAKVEPEDVAQEILMAVHRSFETFRGMNERQFFAWVFRIAENRIRDQATHFAARKRQPVPLLSFSQTSPSTRAARVEMVSRIRKALTGISDEYRKVIQLVRLEERPVPEVAEILGCSENAVRIRYCRALKALRKAMGGQEAPVR